jgi:hypothetical protein
MIKNADDSRQDTGRTFILASKLLSPSEICTKIELRSRNFIRGVGTQPLLNAIRSVIPFVIGSFVFQKLIKGRNLAVEHGPYITRETNDTT